MKLSSYPILDFSMTLVFDGNVRLDFFKNYSVVSIALDENNLLIKCANQQGDELLFRFINVIIANIDFPVEDLDNYGSFINCCRGLISNLSEYHDFLFFSLSFSEGQNMDLYCMDGFIEYHRY